MQRRKWICVIVTSLMHYSDSSPPSWPWGCLWGGGGALWLQTAPEFRLCVPPSLENIKYSNTISYLVALLFLCHSISRLTDLFSVFLLFSATFCLRQLLVKGLTHHTHYSLMVLIRVMEMTHGPAVKGSHCVTARLSVPTIQIHMVLGTCCVCMRHSGGDSSQGSAIIAVLFPPPEPSCTWVTCCILCLWCTVSL